MCVWAHRADLIHQINELHENKDYLPNVKLSTSIKGTTDMKEAVSDADVIIVAVPTKAIREVLRQAVPFITKKAVFVHVSKGIEPDSLLRISEIMEIELPSDVRKDIVVLSGPSHAEEVGLRHPTTVTASSKSMRAAEEVQDLFINHNFRVYTNPDIIGVEIGGALKILLPLLQELQMV